jgi:hypothetical protein
MADMDEMKAFLKIALARCEIELKDYQKQAQEAQSWVTFWEKRVAAGRAVVAMFDDKPMTAASPDLLEAAKDAVMKIDFCADGKINFRRDFADRLRAAIAKATGEAING